MKKILFLLGVLITTLNSYGTVIPVTNVNDSGPGSLRDIIAAGTTNNGDTLKFNNSLITGGSVTLTLASEIAFSKSLTIIGTYNSTDTLYISGNNNSRIFGISSTGNVTLDSLVLINGNGVGAIYNNSGGAIICKSTTDTDTLRILNSIINNNSVSGNGGGIYTFLSTTYLFNSSISNNNATSGGGVYSYFNGQHGKNEILVNNSTINNNSSTNKGGGICFYLPAVYTAVSKITINNSTISNNTSANGGGIYSYALTTSSGWAFNSISNIIVSNSTIADNSASTSGNAIYAYAYSYNSSAGVQSTIDIVSSIVSNGSTNIYNSLLPTITSGGYNIFSDNPNGATGSGDQINITPLQLNLQPLAYNGGTTKTMLPGTGSVAINMGNPNDMTAAQNIAVNCNRRDVGAAEVNLATYSTISPVEICSYTSPSGILYSTSGNYMDTIPNSAGCDSIITINLTINPISDQTVTATSTDLCPTNTGTTITTTASQIGINYLLRDDANDTIIDGPITGTGNGLTFNTGALSGNMTYNVVGNKDGYALSTSGTGYVDCGISSLGISGDITVEAWVHPDATTGTVYWDRIVGNNWTSNFAFISKGGVPNSLCVGMPGKADVALVPGVLIPGQWQHVAFTFNPTTNETIIYHNGAQVSSEIYTPNARTDGQQLNIGAHASGIENWIGDIDNVRIWNTVKSPSDISNNMNNCLSGSTPNLVGLYKFENGSGTTVSNLTGLGSNGTFMGDATWSLNLNDNCLCSQVMATTVSITVQDTIAPVADATSLSTVTGQCSVAMPTAPTATDACEGTITGTTTTVFPLTMQGDSTITWTFDDGNGNTSTQTQLISIQDTIAPVGDVTNLITTTAECSIAMPTAPTATDNCSGAITGTTTTTFPITTLGTTIVTWTYDDGMGNTSTQDQTFIVTDSYGPVPDVTNLPDVTATCEVTNLTDPTATDACSANVTVTNDATLPINTIGTTVVTWTYDDGNGNTSTQTQNVIITAPVIDITTTTTGLTISANNTTATSYQWIDCNNNNAPIIGETNNSYTATVNGDYAVVITEGSCSDTSACVNINNVGIEELSDLGVSIYPNPNNGEFTLSTTANNLTVTIYSIDGKVIVNNLKVTQPNQSINLGDIESGVYFVKVMNDTNQKTIRLVVE